MKKSGFSGKTIVSFESRQAEIMKSAIEKQGGNALSAPSMKEVSLEKHVEVFQFGEKLLASEIDQIIFMTGVGTRMLIDILKARFIESDIFNALNKTKNIVRGPKPKKALFDLGLPIHLVIEEPNTWKEILLTLDEEKQNFSLQDQHVVVQEYGKSNPELIRGLAERGARVLQVPIYKWELPDDIRPLEKAIEAIISGGVNGAIFTSAQQIRHVLQVAEQSFSKAELLGAFEKVVVASVGPVTSEALVKENIHVNFEPSHPKMGTLVNEFSEQFEQLAGNL